MEEIEVGEVGMGEDRDTMIEITGEVISEEEDFKVEEEIETEDTVEEETEEMITE